MTWHDLEKMFNRALSRSLTKEKVALVFPILALCGLLASISRTLSHGASEWIQMSLGFLPVFLCGALLLAVGIILTRIYHHEVKGRPIQYLRTIKQSSSLFVGIFYLTVPIVFAYLVLWMFLGLFYLLREIPAAGEFIGSVLSFGPFLLVLGSILLGLLTVLTLFYLTPAAALKSELRPQLFERVFAELGQNLFLAVSMPLIALFPTLIIGGLLSLSAIVTQIMYVESGHGLSIALKWLFMMVPFSAILTPAIIFFFNFSAETYVLMRKHRKAV